MNVLHIVPALFASTVLVLPAPEVRQEAVPLTDCVRAYEAAHERDDRTACVELWRANPHWVAVALAADFESAFAEVEAGRSKADTQVRLDRALWGAHRAVDAGLPLVADYVASIVGLDEYGRTLYRQSQKIHERASSTLEEGEHELAAEVAREAVERAIDLGDWWGAAMAYSTLGDCHRGLSTFEDAIVAYAKARVLYRGLGLIQNEHKALVSMAEMANAMERTVRGLALVHAALVLGERLEQLVPDYDDAPTRAELERLAAAMRATESRK